jgi:signal transduction histidine kinase
LGKKKDGTGVFQQISLNTLSDGGLLCITRSIDREVEFERELNVRTRRLQSIVGSVGEGILLETVDHEIVVLNESLKRIAGIPVEINDLIGRKTFDALQAIKDLVAYPDLFIREIQNNLAQGKKALGQVVVLLNGKVLSRDFIPVGHEDHLEGYLWVYRDITEQELRKEELRKLFERERELNNMKSKFVHTVSHEFKRPVLNTLRGANMLKMLMREHEGLEPLNRTVDALIDELDKLNRQVNRLVNYESLLVDQQLDLMPEISCPTF